MKILFVTTKCPFPLTEGRALRTYNLIRELAQRHRIVLCSYVQSAEEFSGLAKMREHCAEVHFERLYMDHPRTSLLLDVLRDAPSSTPILATKYRVRSMRSKVRTLARSGEFDLVHLDMLHLGPLIPDCGDNPIVLVEHNVESALLRRRIDSEPNVLHRAYLQYQFRKLRRYEARICTQVDHVVTVSDVDSKLLHELNPAGRYTTVPNGVDTAYFRPRGTPKRPSSMVYVGGLMWHPNMDAVRYFCAEILPRIRRAIPEANLTVVGKLPQGKVPSEFAHTPGVRFTGQVDDVRPHIDEATVFVVPLRVGGGTRLKILDALSMGKCIVSTTVGCEGLAVTAGKHLLMADDVGHFADQVIRCLSDERMRSELGRNGRLLVEQNYEWSIIAKELERVYESLLTMKRQRALERMTKTARRTGT